MRVSRLAVGLAFAAWAAFSAPALAGKDSPASRARIQERVDLFDYGKDVGELQYFEMKSGETITIPLAADATTEYYVNGFCDEDCVNLDLVARDADGTEAGIDDADDNGPILNFQATEYRSAAEQPRNIPRPMTIEIRMVACKTEICTAALRIEQVVPERTGASVDDKRQNEFYKSAEEYLRERTGRLAITPVSDMAFAELVEGETARVELALDNSKPTFLIAACDDDCLKGVTLRAFNAAGAEVASYLAQDGKAFLQIPAGSGNRITVEIGMLMCFETPCGAAVQPFVARPQE